MKRTLTFFSLFTSASTLVCCAIPALFVVLGFGAAFAGIVGSVPQLIWMSEHKVWILGFGAVMLALGGLLQWHTRTETCPTDPKLAKACATTRDWSKIAYFTSLAIYSVGAFFAFVAPRIL